MDEARHHPPFPRPGTSQLISRPGTIWSGGWWDASSIASTSASVESWSVIASTRTPCLTARRTSSRGRSEPSDAVVCEWRSTAPPTLARQVGEDRADGDARGALGYQREVLLAPRRPRDVEVRPGQVARELLEEERRVDRAGAAWPDVVQVSDLALEVLAVLVDQRKLPEPFAGGPGGLEEPLGEP